MPRLAQACLFGFAVLVVSALALAQPPQGKRYALLVGVRAYDSDKFTALRFTENDSEELATALPDSAAFASVRGLTSSRGQKRAEDAPTSANLRRELKALMAGKRREDTVLVGLAGHGLQRQVEGKDESFFCPADAQL